MKTSSIRVHAPTEADVGAVVAGEDLARVVFVDLELRVRDLGEVLDLRRQPRIGWIRNWTHAAHARNDASERTFSQPLAPPRCRRRSSKGGTHMQSRATATWEGDLMSGKGTTDSGTGTFKSLNLSWKARTEGAPAQTSPEELLAAAHASCFSMALSNGLAKSG